MSCSSNKKQKMDDQHAMQCGQDVPTNFDGSKGKEIEEREKPSSLLQSFFNYKFNEAGVLVDVTTGEGFNFQFYDYHQENQDRYESLGELITDYVYELLESPDVGLKKLEIPIKAKRDDPKGFIFVSEGYEQKEKLLVLVHGSGVVRAGQWARRLIINDCLDHGTQIPYIKKALQDGYGVVVLNTNQNQICAQGSYRNRYIKHSESPENHFSYVWKTIIAKTLSEEIFIVAHSYGGHLVVGYFMENRNILKKVVAVAFTDSVHSFRYQGRDEKVRRWFEENSVNWVTSSNDLDTPMWHQQSDKPITRVSAGTTKHEETSWKAMDSVFQYFDNKLIDRPQEKAKGQNGALCEDSGTGDLSTQKPIEVASDKKEDSKEDGIVDTGDHHVDDPNGESNTESDTHVQPGTAGTGQDGESATTSSKLDAGISTDTMHGGLCHGDADGESNTESDTYLQPGTAGTGQDGESATTSSKLDAGVSTDTIHGGLCHGDADGESNTESDTHIQLGTALDSTASTDQDGKSASINADKEPDGGVSTDTMHQDGDMVIVEEVKMMMPIKP